MINKKHKQSIRKLLSGTNLDHWSLALQILTGQLSRDNAESMILQYIINIHNYKIESKMTSSIRTWIKEKIINEKLINYFNRTFKYITGLREQLTNGHTVQHNGVLTLCQLEDWFDSIITSRKQKSITLSCGKEIAELFDELIKEEINV